MKSVFWLRILVSAGAVGLVLVRFLWPNIEIDLVTIGLLIVAILPWLTPIIESAEFPGGWKVRFRDVEAAARKVTSEPSLDASGIAPASFPILTFPEYDPNIILVSLRIEIEKRLRSLCAKHGIAAHGSLTSMFRALREAGVLAEASLSGLHELITAGNSAAHGAAVEASAGAWARTYGPEVLGVLDAKLAE